MEIKPWHKKSRFLASLLAFLKLQLTFRWSNIWVLQRIWPERYLEHGWKWLFLQSVTCKGFNSDGKESQKWKKVKAEDHCCNGEKISKPIMIRCSKKPRCSRLAGAPDKFPEVSYLMIPNLECKWKLWKRSWYP